MKVRMLFHAATALQLIALISYRGYASTFSLQTDSTEFYLLESINHFSEGCAVGTIGIWLLGYAEMRKKDRLP